MAIHLGKQYLDQTDKKTIEHTGANGEAIQFDMGALSKEERAQLKKILNKSGLEES